MHSAKPSVFWTQRTASSTAGPETVWPSPMPLPCILTAFCRTRSRNSPDLCPVLNRSPKALNPDILVHNRSTKTQILAVICRTDYLTEPEQDELIRFRKESKCDLVLALSFMVQKNYMLIYVANEDKIEYYHFERNSQTLEPVRSKNLEGQGEPAEQLTLDKILKRH